MIVGREGWMAKWEGTEEYIFDREVELNSRVVSLILLDEYGYVARQNNKDSR